MHVRLIYLSRLTPARARIFSATVAASNKRARAVNAIARAGKLAALVFAVLPAGVAFAI